MNNKQFSKWLAECDFTKKEAATRLGITERTINSYITSAAIPLRIELACNWLKLEREKEL